MKIQITGLKVTLLETLKPRPHKYIKAHKVPGMKVGVKTNQELDFIDMYEGDTLTLEYNLDVNVIDLLLAIIFRKKLGNHAEPPKQFPDNLTPY